MTSMVVADGALVVVAVTRRSLSLRLLRYETRFNNLT